LSSDIDYIGQMDKIVQSRLFSLWESRLGGKPLF